MKRKAVSLMAAVFIGGCATMSAPTPSEETLWGKAIEVGRAMGLEEPYQDRTSGILVWRIHVTSPDAPSGCDGLFAWHMKRLENGVALNDPILLRRCGDTAQQAAMLARSLRPAMQRLQEDFKRRWLDLVGPVKLIGPTPATHSASALDDAFKRASELPR